MLRCSACKLSLRAKLEPKLAQGQAQVQVRQATLSKYWFLPVLRPQRISTSSGKKSVSHIGVFFTDLYKESMFPLQRLE